MHPLARGYVPDGFYYRLTVADDHVPRGDRCKGNLVGQGNILGGVNHVLPAHDHRAALLQRTSGHGDVISLIDLYGIASHGLLRSLTYAGYPGR